MSEKDVSDLRWALGAGVDYVALSFVRNASDAADVRAIMEEEGVKRPIIAKIEKPQAVENLDEIMDAFDAFMVARGDLGVELPLEDVPIVQKLIVEKARRNAKPVIVATQMLESMISLAAPHARRGVRRRQRRARRRRRGHAVGRDERRRVTRSTPSARWPTSWSPPRTTGLPRMAAYTWQPKTRAGIICRGAATVAESIEAKYVVAFTTIGGSARRMARYRSHVPVLALTPDPVTRNQLALTWGVQTSSCPRSSTRRHGAAGRHRAARAAPGRDRRGGRHRGRCPSGNPRLDQRAADPPHRRRGQRRRSAYES